MLWIENWDPEILHGDGFETGTVFVTTNHGPNTQAKHDSGKSPGDR